VFHWGGKQSSSPEENGACRHVNTPMVKLICERDGKCARMGENDRVSERDAESRLYNRGEH